MAKPPMCEARRHGVAAAGLKVMKMRIAQKEMACLVGHAPDGSYEQQVSMAW